MIDYRTKFKIVKKNDYFSYFFYCLYNFILATNSSIYTSRYIFEVMNDRFYIPYSQHYSDGGLSYMYYKNKNKVYSFEKYYKNICKKYESEIKEKYNLTSISSWDFEPLEYFFNLYKDNYFKDNFFDCEFNKENGFVEATYTKHIIDMLISNRESKEIVDEFLSLKHLNKNEDIRYPFDEIYYVFHKKVWKYKLTLMPANFEDKGNIFYNKHIFIYLSNDKKDIVTFWYKDEDNKIYDLSNIYKTPKDNNYPKTQSEIMEEKYVKLLEGNNKFFKKIRKKVTLVEYDKLDECRKLMYDKLLNYK